MKSKLCLVLRLLNNMKHISISPPLQVQNQYFCTTQNQGGKQVGRLERRATLGRR